MSVAVVEQGRAKRSGAQTRRVAHAPFSLFNSRIVFPDRVERSGLVVRDGLIHRIGAVSGAASRRIDCAGDYLLPGLIEIHTDNLERHLEPRPGTFWNTDRAVLAHDAELASAGITTACEAITLGGVTTGVDRDEAYQRAIASLINTHTLGLMRADHHLHLRCELGNPHLGDALRRAIARRMPRLISLMEHVPGQGQWRDVERFRDHYMRRYGLTAEAVEELIARRRADQANFSPSNRELVTQFARQHQCLLASHDDAQLADVEAARRAGCTLAEFPVSLEAARAARSMHMQVIAGAPNLVRGGSHSGNVAATDLAREGLIDILSSDYCPSSLIHGVFTLAQSASMPLHIATATATSTPARVLNLHDRGRIEEGLCADLIRVRETESGPIVVAAWAGGRQVA